MKHFYLSKLILGKHKFGMIIVISQAAKLYVNFCFFHSFCCVIYTHRFTCEYEYMRLKTHLELYLYFMNLSLYPGY